MNSRVGRGSRAENGSVPTMQEERAFCTRGGRGRNEEEEKRCGQFWWAELAPIKMDEKRHRSWLELGSAGKR